MRNYFPLFRWIKPTSSGLITAPTERTSFPEAGTTPQQSNDSKQTQEMQTSDVTSGYLLSYSICGWYKTLFFALEFTGRTDGCWKWATWVDEKWKVTQILLQTSLDLVQMYHLGEMFHFPQRHCPGVPPWNSFPFSQGQKSHAPNSHSLTASPSSHTSRVNDFQTSFRMKLFGPVEKGMTELSQFRDVIPKFSNAWDPRHSLLCKVSTLWTLRAPLTSALPVTHWFSPDRFSKFNSLFPTPSCVPPPRRFLEKTGLLQFYKQKTHLISSSNWTLLEANRCRVQDETRKE